ncbi:MAG: DUF3536 domain-containing protein [Saprospiraceae bacterium]
MSKWYARGKYVATPLPNYRLNTTFAPMTQSTTKYVCIHGHFYQPPRENAWLETIEVQDSAAPFHDWNERVNDECYAPNAAARVLDAEQQIVRITNNYARISWNFGPTLLAWLEQYDAATYRAILEADRRSAERFGGHGSAVAQVYNHLIMPLANERDRRTQIRWGVADFEHRFGRRPEGIWLAETAVDTPTLEQLVDEGIAFTILAPRQCRAVRYGGEGDWHDTPGSVDPRRAYRCRLPSGRHIDLFFYDGQVAQGVAFEGLLNEGKFLADRLLGTLSSNDEPQIAQIATDGESYGHHHKRGEMALASCLDTIENRPDVRLTNYAEFLALHPPVWEARIHENSSWSCVHGVERWRSDCGCHTGGRAGWDQTFRGPLRAALDYVRNELIDIYEAGTAGLLTDAWATRDAYITVVLSRDREAVDEFLNEQTGGRNLNAAERTLLLRHLEMQRHAMLMYTSCGWFFNEVSGIETLQILQYANRAVHLGELLSGKQLHARFEHLLDLTPSNVYANAGIPYRDIVQPARVGLLRVGMHLAASALFEDDPAALDLFNYRARVDRIELVQAGAYRLAYGRFTIESKLTFSHAEQDFAVLYLGQQSIIGNISRSLPDADFEQMEETVTRRFRLGDLGGVLAGMQEFFHGETFSVWHLFRDEKRKILLEMVERSLTVAESNFANVYYDNYQLIDSMRQDSIPLPEAYRASVRFVLHCQLEELLLDESPLDERKLVQLAGEIEHWDVKWDDAPALELAAAERLERKFTLYWEDTSRLERCLSLLVNLKRLRLNPDPRRAQNIFFDNYRREKAATVEVRPVVELIGRAIGFAL